MPTSRSAHPPPRSAKPTDRAAKTSTRAARSPAVATPPSNGAAKATTAPAKRASATRSAGARKTATRPGGTRKTGPRNAGTRKGGTTKAGTAAPAARGAARAAAAPRAVSGDAASRREQRRLLQQDLSRAQLLDAAEEVFGAKGFHETTLKEIADLAEFSVGSVYSFFENKDDLFLNVFLRRGGEFLPGMRATAESAASPLETLHALVDYEVEFFRAHPHFGRLFLRSASTAFPTPDLIPSNELGRNFEAAMQIQAGVFAAGQAAGVFRDGDPIVLARMFSGLVSSYQSLDPAVVADDADAVERLPLATLHDIIDGAFRRA